MNHRNLNREKRTCGLILFRLSGLGHDGGSLSCSDFINPVFLPGLSLSLAIFVTYCQ